MSKKRRLPRLGCWKLTSWVCKVSWEGRKPSAELPSTRTNILSGCINFTMLYFPDGLAMLIGREPEIPRSHSAHTLFSRPLHLVRYNKGSLTYSAPQTKVQLSDSGPHFTYKASFSCSAAPTPAIGCPALNSYWADSETIQEIKSRGRTGGTFSP